MSALAISPSRTAPSLTWRVAPFVISAAVLGLLLVCLGAGWVIGRWAAPSPTDITMRRINHLDLSFTQGYLDGSRQGRALAERSDAALDTDAMTRSVDGSLQAASPVLASRGPDYARGFREGTQAGMRQRMKERFGAPGAAVAPTPQPAVVYQAVVKDGPQVSGNMGGIRCIERPDGSVEYTNL